MQGVLCAHHSLPVHAQGDMASEMEPRSVQAFPWGTSSTRPLSTSTDTTLSIASRRARRVRTRARRTTVVPPKPVHMQPAPCACLPHSLPPAPELPHGLAEFGVTAAHVADVALQPQSPSPTCTQLVRPSPRLDDPLCPILRHHVVCLIEFRSLPLYFLSEHTIIRDESA